MGAPRLHLKDLQRRYGWCERTIYRMLERGKLPTPIRFTGPLWRLEDLEAAELAGQIPRPVSG
jgi:predicted DNA-binding transcriptional regulator AlpA